jgi:hypothetical protein
MKIHLWRLWFPLLLAALACSLPGAAAVPNRPSEAATPPAAARPTQVTSSPLPEHRIGVRLTNGEPEFYDRLTGQRFVPRGANLWRWKHWPRGQEQILIDTMFNTQIGQLDSALAELPRMHADGFNLVRVWENACWGGAPGCMDRASGGLDPAYLKNLARFLQVAKENGIYVMLTLDELPDTGGYRSTFDTHGGQFAEFNLQFMTQVGIEAQRRYYADFTQGLQQAGAPTDAIFAYELHNEGFFQADRPPLSATSGHVTPANGNTYDLADPVQRRALMEDSWVHYIDQVNQSIKALDPTALVTMGFFVQHEPNRVLVGDPRLVYLHKVLYESALDFVDLHAYPGYDLNMRQHAENFDIIGYNKKPLVMGEFGADRHVFPDVQTAAMTLQAWQAASCEFGFDGWLMWTWGGAEMPDDYWEAVEADGVIRRALSPSDNPDPCAVTNLALNKAVQYSAAMPGMEAALAADGDPETVWNSGVDAAQWLQIDLGHATRVGRIRLVVSQYPQGPTTHQIWVGADAGSLSLVYEFGANTKDSDVLEYAPATPLADIRFVKIVTTRSPSWVAWREIEVLGP